MPSVRHPLRALRRRRTPDPADERDLADHSFDAEHLAIMREVSPYTMTSQLRVDALLDAVQHVVERDVTGAFVECGVWRGGSVLAMIRQLQRLDRSDRDIYLFDTFEGMTTPTEADTSRYDAPALEEWTAAGDGRDRAWSAVFGHEVFNQEQVEALLTSTGYPLERLHVVRGPVEQTIPAEGPEEIALLRLDTDWYESTRHELTHLYPRLAQGGVLIVDDYGHWDGCRRAVDEYFAGTAPRPLLTRVDYTARIAVKW